MMTAAATMTQHGVLSFVIGITNVAFEVVAEWVHNTMCTLMRMCRSSSLQTRKSRDGSGFFFVAHLFHCAIRVTLLSCKDHMSCI